MDSVRLIAIRNKANAMWLQWGNETHASFLESSWHAGCLCRTGCPLLVLGGLWIWAEEPVLPECPVGQGTIAGALWGNLIYAVIYKLGQSYRLQVIPTSPPGPHERVYLELQHHMKSIVGKITYEWFYHCMQESDVRNCRNLLAGFLNMWWMTFICFFL